jgi:hypothetical protein
MHTKNLKSPILLDSEEEPSPQKIRVKSNDFLLNITENLANLKKTLLENEMNSANQTNGGGFNFRPPVKTLNTSTLNESASKHKETATTSQTENPNPASTSTSSFKFRPGANPVIPPTSTPVNNSSMSKPSTVTTATQNTSHSSSNGSSFRFRPTANSIPLKTPLQTQASSPHILENTKKAMFDDSLSPMQSQIKSNGLRKSSSEPKYEEIVDLEVNEEVASSQSEEAA